MTKADSPAYPSPHYNDDNLSGLTKREYFAALAMAANSDNEDISPEEVARIAVAYADALIAALDANARLDGTNAE